MNITYHLARLKDIKDCKDSKDKKAPISTLLSCPCSPCSPLCPCFPRGAQYKSYFNPNFLFCSNNLTASASRFRRVSSFLASSIQPTYRRRYEGARLEKFVHAAPLARNASSLSPGTASPTRFAGAISGPGSSRGGCALAIPAGVIFPSRTFCAVMPKLDVDYLL